MKQFIPAILVAVGLSGCASQSEPAPPAGPVFTEQEKAAMSEDEKLAIYNSQVEDADRVSCIRERKTGSHMQRRKCRTDEQRRLEQKAAEESLRRSRSVPGGGGD
ncbi:hypothetical protein BH24PSE2_BH24PSE2_04470 [soil metagenome]